MLTIRLPDFVMTHPVPWVMCYKCFACRIWPDFDRALSELDECDNCGARDTLCGCEECQHAADLLNHGTDVQRQMKGSERVRIHAAEWTPYCGARKVTKVSASDID